MQEIVNLVMTEYPAWIADVREAVARKDAPSLARSAHRLKGGVSTLTATAAMHAAHCLEVMGQSGNLTGAEEACAAMELEMGRLEEALVAFRSGATP